MTNRVLIVPPCEYEVGRAAARRTASWKCSRQARVVKARVLPSRKALIADDDRDKCGK
jgi:hypothetical protein